MHFLFENINLLSNGRFPELSTTRDQYLQYRYIFYAVETVTQIHSLLYIYEHIKK